ncbi:MAG: hypothetical protein AB7I36_00780 [Rhodospirillaceae bacterium]
MQLHLIQTFPFQSPLFQYVSNVTSQNGEDGLIAEIIKRIVPAHKYCVEFGAWDGKLHSNCHNLVKAHGWGGLMIEVHKERFKELTETYAGFGNVACANRFVDFEGDNKLDNILREYGAPQTPGLVSIDVDGPDYYLWESLTLYQPEIVIIEVNPTVPNDVVFVQDKSFEVNQGCSVAALVMLGRQKGYELAVCTMMNAIFVRADKFPLLGIQNNSHHLMYAPLQNGRIFHGYDGTIHVVGFDGLMWNGARRVTSAAFQLIPETERKFDGNSERDKWSALPADH